MKTRLGTFSAAIIAVLAVIPAAGASPSAERDAVGRAYNVQNKAAQQKDINSFMSIYAPDFRGSLPNGKLIGREVVRQEMLALFAGPTRLSGTTSIQSFSLRSDKAYVTTKERSSITFTDSRTHRSKTLVDDEVNAAVWRKIGGAWKQESVRSVTMKMSPPSRR